METICKLHFKSLKNEYEFLKKKLVKDEIRTGGYYKKIQPTIYTSKQQ